MEGDFTKVFLLDSTRHILQILHNLLVLGPSIFFGLVVVESERFGQSKSGILDWSSIDNPSCTSPAFSVKVNVRLHDKSIADEGGESRHA